MKIDNRKDILLLFLYSPGKLSESNEPVNGRTRLIKSLFLFKEEGLKHFKGNLDLNEDNFYKFFPWNFGPFSSEIYDDLNFFILNGFIEQTLTDNENSPEINSELEEWNNASGINFDENDFPDENFRLTERGTEFAKPLFLTLSESQRKFLKQFKSKMNSTPLLAINRYVYSTYPNFATKSKIKDKIFGVK